MPVALLAAVAVDTVTDTVYKRLRLPRNGDRRQVGYVRIENYKSVLPFSRVPDVIVKIVAGACGIIKNFLSELAANVARKAVYCTVAAGKNDCIVAGRVKLSRNIGYFRHVFKRYSLSVGLFQLFRFDFAVFVICKRVVKNSYHFEPLLWNSENLLLFALFPSKRLSHACRKPFPSG